MNLTLDEVRGMVLLCARAFSGKRGRSGIIKFLLGEASVSTQQLARERGIQALFDSLGDFAYAEVQQSFNYLERSGFVETVAVQVDDRTLPLVQITARGHAELERLRPILPLTGATQSTADKMLLTLTKLGKLIAGLKSGQAEDLGARMGCTDGHLRQYMQLLCKVLQLRPEAVLATVHSRQHLAGVLERALCLGVYADLTEAEAQSLRLYTGMELRHQLSRADLHQYYDIASPEEKARHAAGRLTGREWQHKHPLVSVLGFLSLAEV